MKRLAASLVLSSLLLTFCVVPAFAQTNQTNQVNGTINTGIVTYGTFTGLGTKDLREGVMGIINLIFTFLGVIAIVLILYAGFLWLVSAGSEEKVGQAKKIITGAVIGLVIIFISYAIAQFVISELILATGAVATE